MLAMAILIWKILLPCNTSTHEIQSCVRTSASTSYEDILGEGRRREPSAAAPLYRLLDNKCKEARQSKYFL